MKGCWIIICEVILLSALIGFSIEQACGCDCGRPFTGIKSYISGKDYPSLSSQDSSPFVLCPCACQPKLRFPIEILPIYLFLAIYLPILINRKINNARVARG